MRLLLVTVVALSLAGSAAAGEHFVSRGSAEACAPGTIQLGDDPVEMEKQVIQASDLRTIDVDHAPLTITGGSGSGYTITVCKAATSVEALSQIRVAVNGGRLETTGPRAGRWTAVFHVVTPRGATLDVDAQNGPVSVDGFNGRLHARTRNGPLTLRKVEGNVDAQTTNGPISLSGGSGEMKLRAANGPLSIRLEGSAWSGEGIDAATENGPLSVHLPRAYGSQVVVESSGRGPIACDLDECAGLPRIPGREAQRLEIGRGVQNVRLATVNGPIVIKED